MSVLRLYSASWLASIIPAAVPIEEEGIMSGLSIDTELARKILTGFIQTEISRAGFKRAVLGLSGGLDSALTCYLAAEALGADNVLAVRMPYRTSSQDSLDHAQLVIDALGVRALTIPITEMVDPLINRFPNMENRRKGNIMARERMIILFDQSEDFKGLVVGTGNKTEILLGYSTLYGDSACAINPIGDLYKTQVRQLSAAMGIPKPLIDKAPSADLWIGQTDEGELGFTYEEVDKVLNLLIDERFTPEECVEAGFAEEFVRGVLTRVRRNQFKRVLPPIAKLSNRTIGYDFLYLRDWGT
jgi:NAD+ synthase